MKVYLIANPKDDPEYAEGYHYALEVRFSTGEVLNRWTFRTAEHAQREQKRLALQLLMPEIYVGEGPIPC